MSNANHRQRPLVCLATGLVVALGAGAMGGRAQPVAEGIPARNDTSVRVVMLGPSWGGASADTLSAESAARLGVDNLIAFHPSDQAGATSCVEPGVYELHNLTVVRWPGTQPTAADLERLGAMLQQGVADTVLIATDRAWWADEAADDNDPGWSVVHDVLADDARVAAVVAVRGGLLRDDGERDGIRYLGLPPSSGLGPVGLERFSQPAVVLMIGDSRGIRFTHFSPSEVHATESFPGRDVDDVQALHGAVSVQGAYHAMSDGGAAGSITVALKNPTSRDIPYALAVSGPGWTFDVGRISGVIAAGSTESFAVSGVSPVLTERPTVELRGRLRVPLTSGGWQSVPVSVPVTVRPGVPSGPSDDPDKEMALRLDSRSAALFEPETLGLPFTIECWVWSERGTGDQLLMSAPGFELAWSQEAGLEPSPAVVLSPPNQAPQHLAAPIRGSGPARPASNDSGDGLMGRWVHVAVCAGPAQAVLYIDGEPVGSLALESETKSSDWAMKGPWVLGGVMGEFGRVQRGFSGLIDQVRVSSAVRYDGAFTPSRGYESDALTVLLLRFDEQLGPVVADDSPARSHGWGVGRARVEAVAPLP